MKTTILRSFALLLMLAPLAIQAAAPVNDKFEKATVLTPGNPRLLNQNGSTSTADALDPYIGGSKLARSVWYVFDATASTAKARVIINDHAGVRAALFQLKDPDGNAGTLKFIQQTANATANDVEVLPFTAEAGQRYYVCVEAGGLFDLRVQVPKQENDYFDDAIELTGDEGTITGSTTGAINVEDTPAVPANNTPNHGVWYTWTPTFTAKAVVDTCFSEQSPGISLDTIIAIFTGSALDTLVPLASDDDKGLGSNSRVVFDVTAGTTYRIWVGCYQNYMGTFYLSYFKEGNGGTFEIGNAANTVGEGQAITSFHVRRFRAGSVAANVTLSTANISATAASDYTAVNTVLAFGNPASDSAAAWLQQASVTILPDNALEGTEQFTLNLSNPTAGATVGGTSPWAVGIVNEEANSAAGFFAPAMRVKESDGMVIIPLTRAASGGVAITHVTSSAYSNATASGGMDYGVVDFPVALVQGQTQGSFILDLKNDGLFEGNETIVLQCFSETLGVSVASWPSMVITVEDDDLPVSVAGRLAATFDSGGIAGSVDVKIAANGTVTGKVVMARGSFPFTGKLVNGQLAVRLGADTAQVRTLTIQTLSSVNKTYQITLSDGELGTTASTTATVTNYSTKAPCPVAGRYTFADTDGGGGVPQLFAASIIVDASGTATLSGKLFDNTPVVATGAVNASNVACIGASLYAGKGRVSIYSGLNTTPQVLAGAVFSLLRPGRANQSVELPSIHVTSATAVSGRYVPPPAGQRALSVWNPLGAGTAELTGGGFAMLTTKALSVSTTNKVLVPTPFPETLKLTLTPATGLFSGSVIPTGSVSAKPIFGVLLQGGANSHGYGFFLNGITPGRVRLQ